MKSIIKLITYVGLFALSVYLFAFVLTQMWGWFIVPLGMGPLGLAHAFGLLMTLGLVKTSVPDRELYLWKEERKTERKKRTGKEEDPYADGFWQSTVLLGAALIAWGLGASIHHFMVS